MEGIVINYPKAPSFQNLQNQTKEKLLSYYQSS